MEIRVLQYYLTVAREENITKAAEILHITQPTLSRQLMNLEKELGTTLFYRGKRKIILTEAGLLLRRRSEEILELVNKTEAEFHEQNFLINGEIVIGCAECAGINVVSNLLKQFNKLYPNVRYDLYTGNADQVNERIDSGLIDLALLLEPVILEKYEYIRLEEKEVWGVIMPSDVKLAEKKAINVDDFLSLPLIHTKRKSMQNEIENWIGRRASELQIIGTSNLIGNAAVLVKEGLGYALTIEGGMQSYQDNALCFRPLEPSLTTHAVLVWKKQQIFSPTVTKFLDFTKNALKA